MHSPPRRLVFVVVSAAAFFVALMIPDSAFNRMNIDWLFGVVILLPSSFVSGLLSSWLFYRKNDFTCIDPFYIRAWSGVIGGLSALPLCLLLRPVAFSFFFEVFMFGAGPVIAFHMYRRVARRSRGASSSYVKKSS